MDAVLVGGLVATALVLWLLVAFLRFAVREERRQKQLERTLGRKLTLAEARAYWDAEQALPKARLP